MQIYEVFSNLIKDRGNKDFSDILYIVPNFYRIKHVENAFIKVCRKEYGDDFSIIPPEITTPARWARKIYARARDISEHSAILWSDALFDVKILSLMSSIEEIPRGWLAEAEIKRMFNRATMLARLLGAARRESSDFEEFCSRVESIPEDEGDVKFVKLILSKYIEEVKANRENRYAFDVFDLIERTVKLLNSSFPADYSTVIIEMPENYDRIFERLIKILQEKSKNVEIVNFNGKSIEEVEISFDCVGVSPIDESELIMGEIGKLLEKGVDANEIGIVTSNLHTISALEISSYERGIPLSLGFKENKHPVFGLIFDLVQWGERGLYGPLIGRVMRSKYLAKGLQIRDREQSSKVIQLVASSQKRFSNKSELESYVYSTFGESNLDDHDKNVLKKIIKVHDELERIAQLQSLVNFITTFLSEEEEDVMEIISEMVLEISKSDRLLQKTKENFYPLARYIFERFSERRYKVKRNGIDIIPLEFASTVPFKYLFLAGLTSSIENFRPDVFPATVYQALEVKNQKELADERIISIEKAISFSEKTFISFHQYDSSGKEVSNSVIADYYRKKVSSEGRVEFRRRNMFENAEPVKFCEEKRGFSVVSCKEVGTKSHWEVFADDIKEKRFLDFSREFPLGVVAEFGRCPLAGFFELFAAYILKLPLVEDFEALRRMEFGSFVHRVFENMYYVNGQIFKHAIDKKLLHEIAERSFEKTLDEFTFNYHSKDEIRKQFSFLRFFVENESKYRESCNFKYVREVEKQVTYCYGDIKINGKIDRIDKLKDGNVIIIDYKTGKGSFSKKLYSISNRETRIINWQLALYGFILHETELKDDFSGDILTMIVKHTGFRKCPVPSRKGENRNAVNYRVREEVKNKIKEFNEFVRKPLYMAWEIALRGAEKTKKSSNGCYYCPYNNGICTFIKER